MYCILYFFAFFIIMNFQHQPTIQSYIFMQNHKTNCYALFVFHIFIPKFWILYSSVHVQIFEIVYIKKGYTLYNSWHPLYGPFLHDTTATTSSYSIINWRVSPTTQPPPYYMLFNRNIRKSLVAAPVVKDSPELIVLVIFSPKSAR
jgi:hypothetical protein